MRRAVLIVNPCSGRRPGDNLRLANGAAARLREAGLVAEMALTARRGEAADKARQAAEAGIDLVFACGGDGTVHEIIQGLAHQPGTALGIMPLGSANALARHIGLLPDPVAAVVQQMDFAPATLPLGQLTCTLAGVEHSRYFAVLAGAGPDGTLVQRMNGRGKSAFGRYAYYTRAPGVFLGTSMQPFEVTATLLNGTVQAETVVSAMAARVGDLGGLFSPLVRGSSIEHTHLRLHLIRPPGRLSLPAWFGLSWMRLGDRNPYRTQLEVSAFTCRHKSSQPIPVQADGEYLGHTPMTVRLVPQALRLLLPRPA